MRGTTAERDETMLWLREERDMSEDINHNRRRLLGTAAMTLAAIALSSIAVSKSWLPFTGAPGETLAENKRVVHQMTPAAVRLPIEGAMPSLGGATGWLHSPPLTAAGLRGKVVLIDIWTYSCINWLRTLPYVRAWAQKYDDRRLTDSGQGGDRGLSSGPRRRVLRADGRGPGES